MLNIQKMWFALHSINDNVWSTCYLPYLVNWKETVPVKLLGSSLPSFSIFLPLFLTTIILILLHLPSCYTSDDDTRSMWCTPTAMCRLQNCYEDLEELTSIGDGSASSLYHSNPNYFSYRTCRPNAPVIHRLARAREPAKPDTRSSLKCPGTNFD